MNLDIRLPMGMLFTILGLLLTGYGIMSDPVIYQKSLGYNLNLTWGLAILAFGVVMLFFGRRGTSSIRPAEATPDARAGIESDSAR